MYFSLAASIDGGSVFHAVDDFGHLISDFVHIGMDIQHILDFHYSVLFYVNLF